MADNFLESIGRLVEKGYGVAMSRKTRLPLLIDRGADAVTRSGAYGLFMQYPNSDRLRKSKSELSKDTADFVDTYKGSPIALIAGRDQGKAQESIIHESIHHAASQGLDTKLYELGTEEAKAMLSGLSQEGQALRKHVELLYNSEHDPITTIQEMVSFAGEGDRQNGGQILYEINRLIKDRSKTKENPLEPIANAAAPIASQQMAERMSFDQVLDRLKQNVQPVGIIQMLRGGK